MPRAELVSYDGNLWGWNDDSGTLSFDVKGLTKYEAEAIQKGLYHCLQGLLSQHNAAEASLEKIQKLQSEIEDLKRGIQALTERTDQLA